MSYLYYSAVGFVGTVAAGLLITLLTGESNISLAHTDSNKTLRVIECLRMKITACLIEGTMHTAETHENCNINKVILKGSYTHLFIHK